MKIHLLSDLHLEHTAFRPSKVKADVVFLAGDISVGYSALEWASESFGDTPVFIVNGNHEYFDGDIAAWHAGAAEVLRKLDNPNLHFLEQEGYTLRPIGEQPVRILGATLWTDFALFGRDSQAYCGHLAQRGMPDYVRIQLNGKGLCWQDTLNRHESTVAWMAKEAQAAKFRGERVIALTHMAPSKRCCLPVFAENVLTASFASNLERFADQYIDAWFSGHTHASSQFPVGNCMMYANPRGYRLTSGRYENPLFDPNLVIDF